MRKYSFLIYCVSILAGILLSFFIGQEFILILLIINTLSFGAILIFSKYSRYKKIFFLNFFIIFLGLFTGYYAGYTSFEKHSNLNKFLNSQAKIEGQIVEYPDKREDVTYYVLKTSSINNEAINENILLRANRFPSFEYGDNVQVLGKISPVNSNFGDGASRFNYPGFLSKDDIYSIIYYPEITFVSHNKSLLANIFKIKSYLVEKVEMGFTEPFAGLLVGILLGIKQALGSETLDAFKNSGLIHIVVLSGYNIAIIIAAVLSMGRFLNIKTRAVFVTFSVILFSVFAGGGASIVRASIMALIAFYARLSGRTANSMILVFAALAIIALYEPRTLIYDPGLHLSVLATIGVLAINPILFEKIKKVLKSNIMSEVLSTTISAQIMATPYLLWYMGGVSVVGLISNIIVVPIVPLIMLLGAAFLALSVFSNFLASIVALPLTYLLEVVLLTSNGFSSSDLSYAKYSINTLSMLMLYAVIFFSFYFFGLQKKTNLDILNK